MIMLICALQWKAVLLLIDTVQLHVVLLLCVVGVTTHSSLKSVSRQYMRLRRSMCCYRLGLDAILRTRLGQANARQHNQTFRSSQQTLITSLIFDVYTVQMLLKQPAF